MKITNNLAAALLLISLAGFCLNAQAQTNRTYQDSFAGSSSRSQERGETTFVGQVNDALPGYLMLTIKYDQNNSISAGNWTLIVTSKRADGSSVEEGRLEGTISGGSVTLSQNGTVASVNAARLTIKSGRGKYDGVASGHGAFEVSSAPGNRTPFDGALTLTF